VFALDINPVKIPIEPGSAAYSPQLDALIRPNSSVSTINVLTTADKRITAPTDAKNDKELLDVQDLTKMTDALNKYFQVLNANIRFMLHEKTNRLIVQVVDQTNDKVLKEFPPHEFLDAMAAIRDYIGLLLDKKI
jgi:flagellar protein FlaG